MAKRKTKDCDTVIPRHEIEALARCLLPEIQKFFESEEGKREFEEWKKNQSSNDKGIKAENEKGINHKNLSPL